MRIGFYGAGNFFRKEEIFGGEEYYYHKYEKYDDHFVASFGVVLPKRAEIIVPEKGVVLAFSLSLASF